MPTNRKIFLDTCGWLTLLNTVDLMYADATELWTTLGQQNSQIFLTDWIVAETGNGLARSREKSRFAQAVRATAKSSSAVIVKVDAVLLEQGLELYESRADKSWGLVDCVSFCVMSNENIFDAFTNDHHFSQAGFNCLLSITS